MDDELYSQYALRPVAPEDTAAVVAVINQFSQTFGNFAEETVEGLAGFWKTPGIAPADDLRVLVAADGRIAGYAETTAWNEVPVHPNIYQRVLPELVGSPAHAQLLDWAIARSHAVLDKVPEDLRVSIGTFSLMDIPAQEALLAERGFSKTRYTFEMGIALNGEIPAPQWPHGIRLQPFDLERDLRKVYAAHDQAFEDHFGHQAEEFEKGLERFRHLLVAEGTEYDPSLWFIAMDGDEIAGYLVGRKRSDGDDLGWVNLLGVRRPWRKLGLGLALLQHGFRAFQARGWRRAELNVDGSSLTGAVRLYERAGMQVIRRHARYEKELRAGKELMTVELSSQ
jgi:ribosomal protein S18 acetylase RimI-like enzyme